MSQHLDLYDPDRDREVPVTLYLPSQARPGNPVPLVVFSTGFGGGRDGYRALAGAWAEGGLAVAVVEHAGSGRRALEELNALPRSERVAALERAVQDPEERRNRPLDLGFALDRLAEDLRLDTAQVGLGGHSFGAYTVLAAGGVPVEAGGRRELLADLRAAAVLAMSPPVPGHLLREEDHARLGLPALVVTGTRDHGPFLDSPPLDRARAFEALGPGPRGLAVFEGADHMTFAEMGLRYKPYMKPLQDLTLGFWRAVLAGGGLPDEAWVREHVGGPDRLSYRSRS